MSTWNTTNFIFDDVLDTNSIPEQIQRGMFTSEDLDNFLEKLFQPDFITSLKNGFTSNVDALISVLRFPFDLYQIIPSQTAETTAWISGSSITDLNFYPLGSSSVVYDIIADFTCNINGSMTNSYLDYSPYVKINLYLPYYGFVELNPEEVIGQRIRVGYVIDTLTGMCTALIDKIDSNNKRINLISENFTIGFKVAVGGTDYTRTQANLYRSIIKASQTAINMVGTVGTSSMIPEIGPSMITSTINKTLDVTSDVVSAQKRFNTFKGSLTDKNGIRNNNNVTIIYEIMDKVDLDETEYAKIYGKPLSSIYSLGDLTGLTIIEQIHLEGFNNALNSELNEIETLLKQGVLL